MHVNTTTSPQPHDLQSLSRSDFWQRHIAQWHDSGLSKVAYCRQYSLVYHQMVYWCTKNDKLDNAEKNQPNGFVPVTVSPQMHETMGVTVRLPNGIAIEGIDDRSISLLSKLVKLL